MTAFTAVTGNWHEYNESDLCILGSDILRDTREEKSHKEFPNTFSAVKNAPNSLGELDLKRRKPLTRFFLSKNKYLKNLKEAYKEVEAEREFIHHKEKIKEALKMSATEDLENVSKVFALISGASSVVSTAAKILNQISNWVSVVSKFIPYCSTVGQGISLAKEGVDAHFTQEQIKELEELIKFVSKDDNDNKVSEEDSIINFINLKRNNNHLANLDISQEKVIRDGVKSIKNQIALLDEHYQVSVFSWIPAGIGLLAAAFSIAGLGVIGLPFSVLSISLGCIVMGLNMRINHIMEKQTGIPIVQKSVIISWVRFQQYIEALSEPSQKTEEIEKEIEKIKNHRLDVKAFSIIRSVINSNKRGDLKENCIKKIAKLILIKEKDKSEKIHIFKRNHTTFTVDELEEIKLKIEEDPMFSKIFNAENREEAKNTLKETLIEDCLKKEYSTIKNSENKSTKFIIKRAKINVTYLLRNLEHLRFRMI